MSGQIAALKTRILLVPLLQTALLVLYVAGVWLLRSGDVFSALTGCLIGLIPQIHFSFRMYRQAANDDAANWLGHAYRAALGKWLMTGLMFFIAFISDRSWNPVVLFIGYLLTQGTVFFAHMTVKR